MVGNCSPARTQKKTQKRGSREGGGLRFHKTKKNGKTDGQLPTTNGAKPRREGRLAGRWFWAVLGGFGWWMTKISIINGGQDGVSEVDQDRQCDAVMLRTAQKRTTWAPRRA